MKLATLPNITLLLTTLTTGLVAGLLYAYACSVNPGLKRLPDAEYLSAMQSINSAILNPVFFASFMGVLLLLPASTFLHYRLPLSPRFWLLLAAALIYVAGVFGVTMMGNVPLNDALASFDIKAASAADIAAQRLKFEQPWNNFHSIRTFAAFVSFALVAIACIFDSTTLD